MKELEQGKDKVKKICEMLKQETIDPAKKEAEVIVAVARVQAEEILLLAEKEADAIRAHAKLAIEKEQAACNASLRQASRQTIDMLRQKIEEKLFNPALSRLVRESMHGPKALSALVTAVVKALDKEGTSANLSVYIPASIPAQEVNQLVAQEILNRLEEKSVLLSSIGGGIEVKLKNQDLTLDITDKSIKELMAQYIQKDFRELFFEEIS